MIIRPPAANQVAGGQVTDHDSGTKDWLITAKLARPPPPQLNRHSWIGYVPHHVNRPKALENLDGSPH
jgi:hypothetical protein